jgi:hypothetical protein
MVGSAFLAAVFVRFAIYVAIGIAAIHFLGKLW